MVVRDQYFDPAYQLLPAMRDSPKRAAILFRYALFAERQYQAVVVTAETDQLLRDVESKKKEINELEELISSQGRITKKTPALAKLSQDRRRAGLLLEQDSQKYRLHVQKLDVFLQDSLRMFAECLTLSDEYDSDIITRFCSLWFRNFEEDQIQHYIAAAIASIPSRKFVFFAHQLSALLSASTSSAAPLSSSARALRELVLRLCKEHPFHSLYQVHALWKGDGTKGVIGEKAEARRQAAISVLNQIRGQSVEGTRLRHVEAICEAYIEWAICPIPLPTSGDDPSHIPRHLKLVKLVAPNIPIPTNHLDVDITCKYNTVVGIARYTSRYKTSGGINLPKICDCQGTDGNLHRQVVRLFLDIDWAFSLIDYLASSKER